ncbi:AMP-binding protein [Thalassotalea maritima]|uniref:AMP-binding protein n=1 Tax=Thalassotalea maritima TaxID=3242416 RepID=UPI0035282B44
MDVVTQKSACFAPNHPAKTIAELATKVPEAYHGIVALQDEYRQIRYEQLSVTIAPIAKALIANGINKGDRVAIWAPNTIDWVLCALAVHSCGAILVPINTRMKGKEAAQVLHDSDCRLLFTVGEFLKVDYPAQLDDQPISTRLSIVLMANEQSASTRDVVRWNEWLDAADNVTDAKWQAQMANVSSEDAADILFTSGTTGKPKGAVCGHGATLTAFRAYCANMDFLPGERYLIINPFFHAFGYKAGWVSALLAGCTILPEKVFDSGRILSRIADDNINILPGPPTLYTSLLHDKAFATTDLSSLRTAVTGSSSVSPHLVEQMRNDLGIERVVTAYGLTECGGLATMCSPNDSAETIANSSGKAIAGTELVIFSEAGEPLTHGQIGEICLRGYHVMQGYWRNEQATQDTICADGWLHTGDLGMLDEQGNLHITGRLKDMFICGGFNCYPAEIEAIAQTHPDVREVAVIGVPDERMGEVGCVFVVGKDGKTISEVDFIQWCRANMANYKAPRYCRQISEMPVNASNKVLKADLETLFSEERKSA